LALEYVPEEYARALALLRGRNIRHYLHFDVGTGGSFMVNTLALANKLETAIAVDRGAGEQNSSCELNQKLYMHHKRFLEKRPSSLSFDCIVFDGGQSYEAAFRNFTLAVARLRPNGCILFRDINCASNPAAKRLWFEMANPKCTAFVSSDRCGLGIWVAQTAAQGGTP
jgi:hypothetical protein